MNRVKIICGAVAACLLLSPAGALAQEPPAAAPGGAAPQSAGDEKYLVYQQAHSGRSRPDAAVDIAVDAYTASTGDVKVKTDVPGASKPVLYTGEDASVTYAFDVELEGLYSLRVEYYNVPGKGSAIERGLYIDGALPFAEAGVLSFSRTWKDESEPIKDQSGNEMRPNQVEEHVWKTAFCRDASGYYTEPFEFFLGKGPHTLTLVSKREPMAVGSLRLMNPEPVRTYREALEQYGREGIPKAAQNGVKIQAEDMLYKSDKSIYATADKTSAALEPVSDRSERLNIVSNTKFKLPGQWVSWQLDVERDGLYAIAVRFKQNSRDGAYCSRKLLIDGEQPFEEAGSLRFYYSDSWQVSYLGDEQGKPYLFHLKKGRRTLELQVTLGDMAALINQAESALAQLNQCYRDIFIITGSTPDQFRDYRFADLIPNTLETLARQSAALKEITKKLRESVGEKGSFTMSLESVIFDIDAMTKNPRKIAAKLSAFKSDMGALGEWLLSATSQPIDFDWIWPLAAGADLPENKGGFFSEILHQLKLFCYSFVIDYASIGKLSGGGRDESIKVWVTSGRDQSKIIRRMIDQEFAGKSGVSVDLQLVAAGTLLRSILAGSGPDVAMQLAQTEPLNFALRDAVVDLTGFEDFKEVTGRFNPTAVEPFEYSGAVYALPETFSFPMLFYRTDIFREMGLTVPKTWAQVHDLIVYLSAYNLEFGLPFGQNLYLAMLYQNGQRLYNADRTKVEITTDTALSVFSDWINYYKSYGLAVSYDFSNRFRTGEMPAGIADFCSTYNQLSVFAPEIQGQWTFVAIPGVGRGDGTTDQTTIAATTGISIMSAAKNRRAAWEYLKWWTDADAQVEYGVELESILGLAARYASANTQAVAKTPWPVENYRNIMEQWASARCLPETPGSYIISRYIDFAAREVLNKSADPGQTVIKYTKQINSELARKKAEFFAK